MIKPRSPALQVDSLPAEPQGSSLIRGFGLILNSASYGFCVPFRLPKREDRFGSLGHHQVLGDTVGKAGCQAPMLQAALAQSLESKCSDTFAKT